MPSRGRPCLYPITAEKNTARAICRKQYKTNPLPPPLLNTQLEHSFIIWNPAEGPVADPPITQTTDIFTDLHQTILGNDVAALLDYTSDSSTSVDPGIEDNTAEVDNMDLERDSNTDGDEPPPSGILAATNTEAPRPTCIQVACPAAILAQELVQQLIQHHGCRNHHQSDLSCKSTESGILTTMPLLSLIRGVESTYTGDGKPSELVGVQKEQYPPPPDHAFQIQFDIDSAGRFTSSLAVTRQRLHWTVVWPPVSNLISSLYLAPVPSQQPLHQILYLPLGRLHGMEAIEENLTDEVFLPALYITYPESVLQYLPASAPEHLHALWEQVQALLLLISKNLKNWIHNRTWISTQSKFFGAWSEAVNMAYLTEDFYNIGKEIILPGRSHYFNTEPEEPAVFLTWQRCCLEGFSHWLWDVVDWIDQPPEPQTVSYHRHKGGEGSRPENHDLLSRNSNKPESPLQKKRSWREKIYPILLTWAIGSLTMEPSRKSSLRRLGYLYSQYYNSGKAIFTAGSQYVFRNSGLETLALNPGLVQTWEYIGHAVSHSPLALLRVYCHTKHRCHVILTDCCNCMYGIRKEYRITGTLLVALNKHMQSLGITSQVLTTGLILDWLCWNINKFCLGFKMVYSLQPRTLVHWEHIRVIMMFLQCLLYIYSGQGAHPRRCNGLWLDHRVQPLVEGSDQERVDEGLDMEQVLYFYRYVWLPEHKIDWASMMFRLPYRAHMVFNTPYLLTAYHSQYCELDFSCSALLLQLLVDLCLQVFRKDVFKALDRGARIQHINVLFACLWGWEGDRNNDNWKCQYWENKPYRVLACQCFKSIAHVYGLQQAREWQLSGYSRVASFYRNLLDKISNHTLPAGPQRVVIQLQEMPALPVSGWQRSEQPMPLNIILSGILTDLDEYLAVLPESVNTESTLAIPFPMISVIDRPIHHHVLAEAPEQKKLPAELQQVSYLTVPRLKRADIAHSRLSSSSIRFPEQRAVRKHRIHKAKLQDMQHLVNSFYKEKEHILQLCKKSISHGLWDKDIIPEYQIMYIHQQQVCFLLTQISKQVLEEV
ncbi:hypothetical protein BDV23DRAFT_192391 [Aspergillus alliaceus]|uniref:Uncharacterized protein n=1 Tax=Petromyces alliaceus TaxID=209559 RepID=A0A5N7BQR7_PETAA|nr:hypothetical protein BDV23DRAFT_192391 [Aspergillus alliaceus]